MTPVVVSQGDRAQTVWRYMSFSRFIWLLQRKQLWLARADTLGDPWEISLAGEQLDNVLKRHPPPTLPLAGKTWESAMERVARIIPAWRRQAFVNCWNASEHESHALWRIYCGATEGIAVQSTLGKLVGSSGAIPIYRVAYQVPGFERITPTLLGLVTQKRPMFAYEQEVRLVHIAEFGQHLDLEAHELGKCLPWNPADYVESIRVHPLADGSFLETVTSAVEQYAPGLKDRVEWSAMRDPPPA